MNFLSNTYAGSPPLIDIRIVEHADVLEEVGRVAVGEVAPPRVKAARGFPASGSARAAVSCVCKLANQGRSWHRRDLLVQLFPINDAAAPLIG